MNEPTKKDRIEALTWLGYVIASPLAILGMTMLLLSACAPVDLCPDRQCEYGYAETPGEAPDPAPSPEPDKGDDGKGEGKGKGDRDGKGKGDKGKDGDDD